MPTRIAVLVLACASPPYDQTVEAIRRTWGEQSVAGLDIYYLYGNPHDDPARRLLSRYVGGTAPVVPDDSICRIGDVLIAGCADHMRQEEDCLLRKRLIAFAHLAAEERYDLIYSVCAASYVDQQALVRAAGALNTNKMVAGVVALDESRRVPFVSGASMLLSVDIARQLGDHRQEIIQGNAFGFRDDVTMGHWIATRLSRIPLAAFIEDVEQRQPMTSDHVFVRDPAGTVDYVTARPQDQRPVANAFHYHFHSERPADMVEFHLRYFAPSPAGAVRARRQSTMADATDEIFISIASYRDEFLPFTIRSALEGARHPDRLRFGVCWQAADGESLGPYVDDPRFRIIRFPYWESRGYGWSRAEVQKLYRGEKYHLLIDSHSYLAPGWDENLIAQLESKPSSKPLLTTSAPPFTLDARGGVVFPWAGTDRDGVPLIVCRQDSPLGFLDFQMSTERSPQPDTRTYFMVCNFVFTHGRWIVEVPEDPDMINASHESALSVRTYTHGYDMFLPDENQVWHLDYRNYSDGYRRTVWETKSKSWQTEATERLRQRLDALIYGRGDAAILGRYGRGTARSIEDWAAQAGVDLRRGN